MAADVEEDILELAHNKRRRNHPRRIPRPPTARPNGVTKVAKESFSTTETRKSFLDTFSDA